MVEVLFFLLLLLAPVPFALWLARVQHAVEFSRLQQTLTCLVVWTSAQWTICHALAFAGWYTLPAVVVVESGLLVLGSLVYIHASSRGEIVDWFRTRQKVSPLALVLLTGFAVILWQVTAHVIVEYDSLAYHLPAMATFFQTGRILIPGHLLHTQGEAYTHGWELLASLMIFPVSRDFLVLLPNLVAYSIMGFSVFLLSVTWGAAPRWAFIGALLQACFPIVLESLGALQADLPLAAFFVAGLYYAVLALREAKARFLLLGLACSGILLGTKLSSPPFLLIVWSVCGAACWRMRRASISWGLHVPLVTLAAGCLFSGGAWYLQNWVRFSNPLGLVEIRFGDRVIFPGSIPMSFLNATSLLHVFNWSNGEHRTILAGALVERLQAPGILACIGIVFLIGATAVSVLRLQWQRAASPVFLLALFAVSVYLYWASPYTAHNYSVPAISPWIGTAIRYAEPALALAGVAAALGFSRVLRPHPVLVSICAALAVDGFYTLLVPEGNRTAYPTERQLAGGIVAALAYWLLVGDGKVTLELSRAKALALLSAATALVLIFSEQARIAARDQFEHDTLRQVHKQLRPGEVIGYLNDPFSYWLYGKNLDQRVLYCGQWRGSFEDWYSEMRRYRIRYISAIPGKQSPYFQMPELNWLTLYSDKFKQLPPAAPGLQQSLFEVASE